MVSPGVVSPGHRWSAGGRRRAGRRLPRRLARVRRRTRRRRHLPRHLGLRHRGAAGEEYDARSTVSWSSFYARRIRRLLPAAALVIGVTVGMSILLETGVEQSVERADRRRRRAHVDRQLLLLVARTRRSGPCCLRRRRTEPAAPHVDACGGGAVLPAGTCRRAGHLVARARADREAPYDAARGPACRDGRPRGRLVRPDLAAHGRDLASHVLPAAVPDLRVLLRHRPRHRGHAAAVARRAQPGRDRRHRRARRADGRAPTSGSAAIRGPWCCCRASSPWR